MKVGVVVKVPEKDDEVDRVCVGRSVTVREELEERVDDGVLV